MNQQAAIYMGEDAELTIDLIDTDFTEVEDVIVGFVVGQTLRKTCKKSSDVAAFMVTAHETEDTKCIARLFRSETAEWPKGPLSVEVTVVYADPNFPEGKHMSFKQYVCEFDNFLTKSA